MNRQDKIFIIFITISTLLLLFFSDRIFNISSQNAAAVVYYKNKEVARYDLSKDQVQTHQGTLGDVVLEIKEQQVRVLTENSPLHICSIQGWVKNMYVPIVCLPNELVIQIEDDSHEIQVETDDVDGSIG